MFIALSESMDDVFKREILKEAKLAPLDKVLYKWFTTMGSKGNTVTGPTIMKIAVLGPIYVRTCRVRNGYHTGHADVLCNYFLIFAFMLQRGGTAPGACAQRGPLRTRR